MHFIFAKPCLCFYSFVVRAVTPMPPFPSFTHTGGLVSFCSSKSSSNSAGFYIFLPAMDQYFELILNKPVLNPIKLKQKSILRAQLQTNAKALAYKFLTLRRPGSIANEKMQLTTYHCKNSLKYFFY